MPIDGIDSGVIDLGLTATQMAYAVAANAAREGASLIEEAIREDVRWHRQHPYIAYRWHSTLAKMLPRWNLPARWWHQARARRSWALAYALDAEACLKAETQRVHPAEPDGPPK